MPRLAAFYGIVVTINWEDHPPPHVHIWYGGHRASLDIATLDIAAGHLPRRTRALVVEWASEHRDELRACWESVQRMEHPPMIDPLD
jgi:hypothetical protein